MKFKWSDAREDASALPPIMRPLLYFLYYPGRPLLYAVMWYSMHFGSAKDQKCIVCGKRGPVLVGKSENGAYVYRCGPHADEARGQSSS